MEELSLLDLVSFIVDNRGRSCPIVEQGIPLIATNCITDASRRALMKDVRFVNDETYEQWFRAHPQPNDVLFVCKGSPGRTALVPDPVPYCIAQDMVALRADPATTDPMYLYYRLSAPDVRNLIEGMHVGTLIPHFKKGDFGKLKFPVHPLPQQRRIAKVLGALDDLIESNLAQVEHLNGLAKVVSAKFMSTLANRKTVPLSNFCSATKGFSYKSTELGEGADTLVNLKNIGKGGRFERRGFKRLNSIRYKPAQVVVPGDLIVSMTDLTQNRDVVARPVRVPAVHTSGLMVASLDLAILRPENGYSREFLVAALSQDDFHIFALGYCNGTTVVHLNPRVFGDYQLPNVAPSETTEINAVLSALNAQADACTSAVRELTKVRDQLLPLLMSGRVCVAEVA